MSIFRRQLRRPENVRLAWPDGTETPLELHYDGVEDGCHQWRVVPPELDRWPLVHPEVRVDVWPGKTAIVFPHGWAPRDS